MAESGTTFGVAPLETMKSMSGLEFLRSIANGRLPAPPIAQTLGFRIAEVSQGYVRFEMTPETKALISDKLWAGASLIVSDQGLSHVRGKYTDFIVLTR